MTTLTRSNAGEDIEKLLTLLLFFQTAALAHLQPCQQVALSFDYQPHLQNRLSTSPKTRGLSLDQNFVDTFLEILSNYGHSITPNAVESALISTLRHVNRADILESSNHFAQLRSTLRNWTREVWNTQQSPFQNHRNDEPYEHRRGALNSRILGGPQLRQWLNHLGEFRRNDHIAAYVDLDTINRTSEHLETVSTPFWSLVDRILQNGFGPSEVPNVVPVRTQSGQWRLATLNHFALVAANAGKLSEVLGAIHRPDAFIPYQFRVELSIGTARIEYVDPRTRERRRGLSGDIAETWGRQSCLGVGPLDSMGAPPFRISACPACPRLQSHPLEMALLLLK